MDEKINRTKDAFTKRPHLPMYLPNNLLNYPNTNFVEGPS